MFGISFPELLIIGVIALIVLGPERLPTVARTLGHLLGRAQRYVSDIKSDIQREINLDEVKSLKNQLDDASQSVRDSIQKAVQDVKDPLSEARSAVEQLGADVKAPFDDAKEALSSTAKAVQAPLDTAKQSLSNAEKSVRSSVNEAKLALSATATLTASPSAAASDTTALPPQHNDGTTESPLPADNTLNALSGAFRQVTHDEVQAASEEAAAQQAAATPKASFHTALNVDAPTQEPTDTPSDTSTTRKAGDSV